MKKNKIAGAVSAVLIIMTLIPLSVPRNVYASGDTTIPTLTAVVNNGMLTVDATDDASGISAIYINGFEFTELNNGSITIRMQQYDTGYQYFTMQAKDGAGNLSEVYRVNNPYYTFPDEDNGAEDPSLPSDAEPTKPSSAEGEVTDHVKTDNEGKKTDRRSSSSSTKSSSSSSTKSSSSSAKSSSSSVKEKAVEEYDKDGDYEIDSAQRISAEGREFYTIMTKTGKVFYLVIDRTKDEETVHFLTDITENDLLNVTEDNKPTLPQNSAVVIKDAGLEAGSGRDGEEKQETGTALTPSADSISEDSLLIDDIESPDTGKENPEELSPLQSFLKNNGTLIAILCLSLLAVVVYFIIKLIKKNSDEDYVEDEEGEDEDYEEEPDIYYEDDNDGDEDFMDRIVREDEAEKEEQQKDNPKQEEIQQQNIQPQEAEPDSPAESVYRPFLDKPSEHISQSGNQTDPVYMPYRNDRTDQSDLQPAPQPSSDVIYEDPEEEEPEEDEDDR